MEYKNISSKFTLQTKRKCKNTKIQTTLQQLLTRDLSFQESMKNKFCQSILLL